MSLLGQKRMESLARRSLSGDPIARTAVAQIAKQGGSKFAAAVVNTSPMTTPLSQGNAKLPGLVQTPAPTTPGTEVIAKLGPGMDAQEVARKLGGTLVPPPKGNKFMQGYAIIAYPTAQAAQAAVAEAKKITGLSQVELNNQVTIANRKSSGAVTIGRFTASMKPKTDPKTVATSRRPSRAQQENNAIIPDGNKTARTTKTRYMEGIGFRAMGGNNSATT